MSNVKHTVRSRVRQLTGWGALSVFMACTLPINAQEAAGPASPETAADPAISSPAADTAKAEPNQPVAERLAERQRELLHELKGPPTALWLPLGGEQILAFWQPDRSGEPVGAVLMLHAEGENPRRAATLRRLHEYLPLHGWATFSVELPDLPPPAVPTRPPAPPPVVAQEPKAETEPVEANAPVDETQVVHQEADEEIATTEPPAPAFTEDTAPTASREEVIEHIHRRIEAATAYLHQQGQYNLVLLGEGSSTHWVLQHLDKAAPPPAVESADKKSKGIIDRAFRAVILVNARTPADAGLEPLSAGLNYPEIPTFDVFTDLYLDTLAAAQNRRQAAKQQGYENYIVRRLPPPNGADPGEMETLLTKAVRGFLNRYAQGVQLK